MLTSESIKKHAKDVLKIDAIGIANIERFKDAPPDMSPFNIMPQAKSAIVFAQRILRGCYRGIDEGTHWPSYQAFGYAGLNGLIGKSCYRLGCFIERQGFEAVPVPTSASLREFGPRGASPKPGMPPREITMQLRIAAALAGIGEIGWSKVFMTEEFGPRQRLGMLLTDAVLEPDPIVVGKLCDRCKRCVKECPGGAIPKDKKVAIEVEGKKMEWADIDLGKCKLTHFGLNKKSSPHLAKYFPGLYLPIGEQEVTWLEAWNLGYGIFPKVPTYNAMHEHPIPICGARGCIVGCMKHLEKKGVVKNQFKVKKVFSDKTPWELPERPPHVEHHGFVYDPQYQTSEDGKNKFAPPQDWY
jgi:ferredoxin